MQSKHRNNKIRNIAIIAHVDHGKTTLVDHMLRQAGTFRDNQQVAERVMDNLDLERERGITIAAKNCAIRWKGVRINILDTPGHADFGGEVERALKMVDGAILLVDAAEGPLPQTRFVLKKALESHLRIIVVVNKIDRKDARANEVLQNIGELFIDLDATDEQMDHPVLFAVGRDGVARSSLENESPDVQGDLTPLFNAILDFIPGPEFDPKEPFQMLVCDLDYSDYIGRLAIGRVFNGSVSQDQQLVRIDERGMVLPFKVAKLQTYEGLGLSEMDTVEPGDIVVLAGVEEVMMGDTICSAEAPKVLPRLKVDEPTLSMLFTVNNGPFSGREGQYVQTRKIAERLYKETLQNVAIQVERHGDSDKMIVKGRGEFQMEIIIETMRREGYELCVGRPQVIMKEQHGHLLEPMEELSIDCEETHIGIISEKLASRKGVMTAMHHHGTGRVGMEYRIPSRTLLGYRGEFLTDTRGTGIMSSILAGYEEFKGEYVSRINGSLVSDRQGAAVTYAIHHLEDRGQLFVVPGDPVYEGMIVGEHNRDNDLLVNPTKEKKLSNMRNSYKDVAVFLRPIQPLTLGKAIMFIRNDEYVEVTPKSIRLRKVVLSAQVRKRIRPEIQDEDDD